MIYGETFLFSSLSSLDVCLCAIQSSSLSWASKKLIWRSIFAAVGKGLIWAYGGLVEIALLLYFAIYIVFFIASAIIGMHTVCKSKDSAKQGKCSKNKWTRMHPPISIIVPAYNEEVTVVSTINSLLALDYTCYEIIVVDDGSTDKTAERIIKAYGLQPVNMEIKKKILCHEVEATYAKAVYNTNIILICKTNGGKADALNMGINAASYPYFICMDADSILQYDALIKIVEPVMRDETVIAVGGWICPCNDLRLTNGKVVKYRLPKNPLACMQVFEYARSFLGSRILFDRFNGSLIISGAFGLFRQDLVISVGGYDTSTIGEDMELILKLHKYCMTHHIPYRIGYSIDAVCWTQAPERLMGLRKQRERWASGLAQCMCKYRFNVNHSENCGFKAAYFYFVFYELLSPLFKLLGCMIALFRLHKNALNITCLIAILILLTAFELIFSLSVFFAHIKTLCLEISMHDMLKAVFMCIFEIIVLQFFLLFVRVHGVLCAWRNKTQWGHIERKNISVQLDLAQSGGGQLDEASDAEPL